MNENIILLHKNVLFIIETRFVTIILLSYTFPGKTISFLNLEKNSLVRRRSETTLIFAISQHIMKRFTRLSEYCIKNYIQTKNIWK